MSELEDFDYESHSKQHLGRKREQQPGGNGPK